MHFCVALQVRVLRETLVSLERVEEGASGQGLRVPKAGGGEPARRLSGVRGFQQREGGAFLEEAPEGQPARPAQLDQREGRHVGFARHSFHERRAARAVGDHRRQFPGLDELGEGPDGVGRPDLSQVIRVVLDEADDVGRLGDPVEMIALRALVLLAGVGVGGSGVNYPPASLRPRVSNDSQQTRSAWTYRQVQLRGHSGDVEPYPLVYHAVENPAPG